MGKRLGGSRALYVLASLSITVALLFLALPAAAGYDQVNLVSDVVGTAKFTDPNLKNPWGIAHSPTSPFWISDNGTGLATLYDGAGNPQALVVTLPPTGLATPTGQVFNGTTDFELTPGNPARFLFATESGTILGWNPSLGPTTAVLKIDNSVSAIYKGLALGNNGTGNFLYAANFLNGTVETFDSNFRPAFLSGSFTDPNLPSGYAPFNVQNIGGSLLVTYALKNGMDDLPGPGHGFVDMFDLNGNFIRRLISQGSLNSPWGLAQAPVQFGEFSNDLLVGNFGDGHINAFDPTTGNFLGPLEDGTGNPIVIDGLWGLIFGNGADANKLYFTAGINDEQHGLFGSVAPVPVPAAACLFGSGLLGLISIARRTHGRG